MIEEKEITFLAFDLSLEGLEQTTGEGWLGADKKFFAKKKHDIYPLNETRATSPFAKKNVSYIPIQLNAYASFLLGYSHPVKVTHANYSNLLALGSIIGIAHWEVKREKHLTKLLLLHRVINERLRVYII